MGEEGRGGCGVVGVVREGGIGHGSDVGGGFECRDESG